MQLPCDVIIRHDSALFRILTPSVFSVLTQLFEVAIQAQPFMAAYRPSAVRAAPLYLFFLQKRIHAIRFNKFEVFNHAQMILCTVSFIKGFQPAAGEIGTLMAESDKAFPNQVAMVFHKDAVFAARQTSGTVCPVESLFIQVACHRLVTDADSTIHPAWSNKGFFHPSAPLRKSSESYHFLPKKSFASMPVISSPTAV